MRGEGGGIMGKIASVPITWGLYFYSFILLSLFFFFLFGVYVILCVCYVGASTGFVYLIYIRIYMGF